MGLLIIVVGVLVNVVQSPAVPAEAQQAVDDFVRRFGGNDFAYKITSAEKAAPATAKNVSNIEGGIAPISWPAGICPPNGPMVQENWCVIINRAVNTSTGASANHLLVQRQGQLWFVEGVSDADAALFREFGCGKW
jgi:hypothetical protein